MKPIVLVGAGGHCRSCIDVVEQTGEYEVVAIVGLPAEVGTSMVGYEVGFTDDDLPELIKKYQNCLITVGQIKSSSLRVSLFEKVRQLKGNLPVIASPLAYVSRHATIAEGTIVMHHAVVNAAADVGINCILNSKSLVEHDAVIGNHCHVSTGAIINGQSIVEDHCFIGSGAVLHQDVRVGQGSVVGSHAVVSKNVPANSFVRANDKQN